MPPECLDAEGRDDALTRTFKDGELEASVVVRGEGCARSYVLTSNAPLRHGLPVNPREFSEDSSGLVLRTQNALFDALYALALTEAKENSVDTIRDGAFADVTCPQGGCFETGRLWTYVWTRDTAYAVDLGLAALDPTRARNSLEFKLSELREGGGRQIVQDTGTGGSYPVSSDRVVWAQGAYKLLAYLDGKERTAFRDLAYDAIRNTIEHDRKVVFDEHDGLYRGEQSFLDWREQSYAADTAKDVLAIARAKALSTNVAHAAILQIGAWLAHEKGQSAAEQRYQDWADALRSRIAKRFWLPEEQQLSTFSGPDLDGAPARRFDALGTSLAVLWGIGSRAEQAAAVASYPQLPKGPPVIWPQQQDTPIYHNRAIWPFVTAYLTKAARSVGNDAAVTQGVKSLVRGAALNLSNMENLELVTGLAWLEEGKTSGPVVNSQRQLWSVAGFVSMVHDVLFGLEVTNQGLRLRPFVPRALRNTLFSAADTLVLNRFPYRGKTLTIKLQLPKSGGDAGAYDVGKIRLNGKAVTGWLNAADLSAENLIEVELLDSVSPTQTMRSIDDVSNYQTLFGPRTPVIESVSEAAGKLVLQIGLGGELPEDVRTSIYRDGEPIATNLPGTTTTFTDVGAAASGPTRCYSVETCFLTSGTCSQRASSVCYWGPAGARIETVSAASFSHVGGVLSKAGDRAYLSAWGDANHTLTIPLTPKRSGAHLLQLEYANGAGDVTTGITCGLKRIEVRDGDKLIASGIFVMPHTSAWTEWRRSSFVRAILEAGKTYTLTVRSDETTANMSRFQHFASYKRLGGAAAFERVDVAALVSLSLAAD